MLRSEAELQIASQPAQRAETARCSIYAASDTRDQVADARREPPFSSLSFSYAAKEAVAIQWEESRAVAVYIRREKSPADGLRPPIGCCYYRTGEVEIVLLSFLASLSRAAHLPIEVQAPGAVDVGVKGNMLAVNIVEHDNKTGLCVFSFYLRNTRKSTAVFVSRYILKKKKNDSRFVCDEDKPLLRSLIGHLHLWLDANIFRPNPGLWITLVCFHFE